MSDRIVLDGVRVHNLKSVHVEIPLGRLTVVTGVSGAGKSSLVFDTLYAEAQRRFLQSFSASSRQLLERFDRPDAEHIGDLPPAVALRRRPSALGTRATVGALTEVSDYLRLLIARAGVVHCVQCGQPIHAARTADVVAAAHALPAGTRFSVAFAARPEAVADPQAWAAALLEEGLIRVQIGRNSYRVDEQPLPTVAGGQPIWVIVDRLEAGAVTPGRLTESIETAFARGHGRLGLLGSDWEQGFDRRLICPRCDVEFPPLEPALFDCDDPRGACPECHGTGLQAKSQEPCPACKGRRWNPAALAVSLAGRNIADLSGLSLAELDAFLASAREVFTSPASHATTESDANDAERGEKTLLDQLRRRLAYLTAIDLGHLTSLQPAATLSGGMTVRVRLAGALAANLAQALYLVEEPTADLHPSETDRLLHQLRQLCDRGNTVVVVEHERAVIAAADHVIDIGPGAGEDGGCIVYEGSPSGLAAASNSPTAEYFTGRETIRAPARRREPQGTIRLRGSRAHNLQDLTVEFPLGVLCVVTGVGGAGKRSLVVDSLYPSLVAVKKSKPREPGMAQVSGAGLVDDVILMDEQPPPRSSRSNPATYLKIFDEIRAVFAATAEAKIRNFGPGHFSFNQPGGRCETCAGQGTLTVDMQFLPDVTAICPECHGQRYRREVLDVMVRGLNIAEVLDLSAREAFRFFRAQPGVQRRLQHLLDVGLDYVRLGQPADTLAGGEAQRLKLAAHLAASRKPRSLFLLVEPSAGLHPADVQRLLDNFDHLVAAGHSLIVIEHNLDIIRSADRIIEMGPGSSTAGGRLVAIGTPEELADTDSATGRLLRGTPAGLHIRAEGSANEQSTAEQSATEHA
jgi:excinuclease ABC subunit A